MNIVASEQEYGTDSGDEIRSQTFLEQSDSKTLVLVVDDDVRIQNFIRLSLRLAGYDVITTTDGEEALNVVDSKKLGIMVLDIQMSPMDGFEVLSKLRMVSELPVIVISAHASAANKAINLGANDFLVKPFRPDELVERIKALLKHAFN